MSKTVYDVAVIGAGVIGAGIAYELSKKNISVALIERASLPTQGSSKGNSGLLHAGYDDPEGSLRAKLVTTGNRRHEDWNRELGFGVRRTGSIVVATDDGGLRHIRELEQKAGQRDVPVEVLDRDALLEAEPNLTPEVVAGLRAPTAGVACPMRVVNALFKNAVVNGVTPIMGAEVQGFETNGSGIATLRTSAATVEAGIVINAAGLFGDVISAAAGVPGYEITPRKGEYILLEPHPSYNVNHIIFPTPTTQSKGVLVIPTETGDILLGPTARDLDPQLKDDRTTTPEGLEEVLRKTRRLVPNLHTGLAVKTYAGNRAEPNTRDFIVERYEEPANFINAIGIRSPGLTAAPAIADMVVGLVEEIGGTLSAKQDFRNVPLESRDQSEEALRDIEWANTLTPNLDSPSVRLLESAWGFGVQKEIYNYSCYTDRGLGVDLGATWQNELIRYQRNRGLDWDEILYRLPGSQQVIPRSEAPNAAG